jgi:hypothetical protein
MTIIYIYKYYLYNKTISHNKTKRKKKEKGWGRWSEEVRKREPSLPAVEEVRDREQRRENRVAEKEMRIESSG